MSFLSDLCNAPHCASPLDIYDAMQRRRYEAKKQSCLAAATILAVDHVNRLGCAESERESLLLTWIKYYTDKLAGPTPKCF